MDGKVVLVTGGSGVRGVRMASEGADVVVTDICDGPPEDDALWDLVLETNLDHRGVYG